MKRYNSYSSSGDERLGQVPEHWNNKGFRYSFSIQKGRIPGKDFEFPEEGLLPYLSMEVVRGGEPSSYVEKDGLVIAKVGDIGILWDGSNSGEIIRFEMEGVVSSTVALLKCRDFNLTKDFAYYYLKFSETRYKANTIGMGIPHVDGDSLKESRILVPPALEQKRIAAFLDHKTTQIDALIRQKGRKIELLKEYRTALINQAVTKGLNPDVEMKDSGVEWIGEIPKTWHASKVSRFVKVKDGTHDTPDYVDESGESVPLVTSVSFDKGDINFAKCKHISIQDYLVINKRSDVQRDDIIMSMIGGNIGNKVLVRTERPFSIKNVCLFKTSSSDRLHPSYLNYLLESRFLRIQIDLAQRGGGQPFLSLDDLRGLVFPFPERQEQKELVFYLDNVTNNIELLIASEEKSTALLREYRQSLISEVVTGKIKVTDDE